MAKLAAADARKRLLDVVAEMLGFATSDLRVENGVIQASEAPGKAVKVAEVATATQLRRSSRPTRTAAECIGEGPTNVDPDNVDQCGTYAIFWLVAMND